MKKKLLLALSLLVSISTFAQTKVGDVTLPNQLTIEKNILVLNGAGTRVKLWMDMYAMGLYVTEKSRDAQKLIEAEAPMAARLEIISGLITAEKMEKATRTGFKKATKGNTAPIATEIEEFLAVFREKIEKQDKFEFQYLPKQGTQIFKNGKLKKVIPGYTFKKALFGIWLCDQPADDNLKEKLLGQ